MASVRKPLEHTILCFSPVARLLFSRSQLLKSAGYEVISAMDRNVAVMAVANFSVDLAVLCDSLAQSEAESIEHDLLTIHPSLVVLQLGEVGNVPFDEPLTPERFISVVGSALTPRNLRRMQSGSGCP